MSKTSPVGVKLTADRATELRRQLVLCRSAAAAAKVVGVHRQTAERMAKIMRQEGTPLFTGKDVVQSPQERFDAKFWQGKAKKLEAENVRLEHALSEVSRIRSAPFALPSFSFKSRDAASGRSVGCMFVSDLHMGEVINGDEILGLNEFSPDIARRRMERYFKAACEILPRWATDTQMEGLVLFVGGDLISGDIHEELQQTNALTSLEQVRSAVEVIGAGIRLVREALKLPVFVVSVPGNHGRQTKKTHSKQTSKLSYDTLIVSMVADRLTDDEGVTFHIPAGRDAVVPILGWNVFMNHGDGIGAGGGQGFGGPMFPIIRGTKKVEHAAFRARRHYDLMLTAHFHTSGNPSGVLANGSVPGYSEYGNGLRFSFEVPQQWLFLMHERWGLRERCEIKLEDPLPPPLPRVRVPAGIS